MAFLHTNATLAGNAPAVGIEPERVEKSCSAVKTVLLVEQGSSVGVFIKEAFVIATCRGMNEKDRAVDDDEAAVSIHVEAASRAASNLARFTDALAASINTGSRSIPMTKSG